MDKKILLIELAGVGDAVLSSPAIKNVKRCLPGTAIYFLAFPWAGELMRKCPHLDKIFIFHKGAKNILNTIYTLNALRSLRIDTAVNLYQHYTLRGALFFWILLKWIHPKRTIGRNTDGRGFFYTVAIDDTIHAQKNDAEYKLDLMKAMGCEISDQALEVWHDDADREEVTEFLRSNSVNEDDCIIGINPGAYKPSRQWHWQNFAKVCDALAEKYRAHIVITGVKKEGYLAQNIAARMRHRAIDATGKLSLTQLAALMKRCNLYISNDTGPMHIANALKVPLVVIMGSGVMKTAPYQKDSCIIVKKDVDCAPCYKFRCNDTKCLDQITPDEVIQASGSLLGIYGKS